MKKKVRSTIAPSFLNNKKTRPLTERVHMVIRERFELSTIRLEGGCSIQLSYRTISTTLVLYDDYS